MRKVNLIWLNAAQTLGGALLLVACFLQFARAADVPRIEQEERDRMFFGTIDELTRRIGWEPLHSKQLAPSEFEVRIWIGFGLMPLEAFVLRRDDDRWIGQHVVDALKKSDVAVTRVTPRSGWNAIWKELQDLQILTLPDESTLTPPPENVLDGGAYVVEVKEGDRYRTYTYTNPEIREQPEAKKIVAISHVLDREFEQR